MLTDNADGSSNVERSATVAESTSTSSLSGLSDRSEPSGRARTVFHDFEAHSGTMGRRIGENWNLQGCGMAWRWPGLWSSPTAGFRRYDRAVHGRTRGEDAMVAGLGVPLRLTRGRGTSATSRARNSRGLNRTWVVPSQNGFLIIRANSKLSSKRNAALH